MLLYRPARKSYRRPEIVSEPAILRITHSDYINISKTMKNNREFSTIIKLNYRFSNILKRD